jgi:hypothetical protein
MNSYLQIFLLSFSIAIPAIIGLVRYKKMDPTYHPFIWICCALTLNETIRYILIQNKVYTFTSYNIALPIICFLYIYQFKRWGLFRHRARLPLIIAGLMLTIWVADHFLINGNLLKTRTYYFRVCYSLLLVLMSVSTINHLIVSEKKNLLLNPKFLICICLMVYYTYRILVDAFSLNNMSEAFLRQLGDFNRYLLIGLNLIFALAALWIPRKKNFTLQF